MKIKSVIARKFKRFADLEIVDLPESARLVVLAGPNGFGKSSLFDAFFTFHHFSSAGNLNRGVLSDERVVAVILTACVLVKCSPNEAPGLRWVSAICRGAFRLRDLHEHFRRIEGCANPSRPGAREHFSKIRLHDLRHTHASLMAMAGQSLDVISKRLGHSNIAITAERYLSVYTSRDEAASEAFATLLR